MPNVDLRIQISEDGSAKLVAIKDKLHETGEKANWAQQQIEKFAETLAHGVALGAGMDVGHKIAEGFIESAKAAIEFGHQIELMSVKTGIGTHALQEFDFAAKISGTTLDSVASLVTKMDSAIEKASPGFEKLGLDVSKLKQETPEQAFRDTAEALAGVGNQIERVAIAREVFGRAGAEALPFIENMEHGAQVAREMGLVLSEEDVKATAELGAAGMELEEIWAGVSRQFVAGIASGHDLKEMIEEAAPAVKALGEAFRAMGDLWDATITGMTLGMNKLFGAGLGALLGKEGLMGAMSASDFANYKTKGSGKFIGDEAAAPGGYDFSDLSGTREEAAKLRLKKDLEEEKAALDAAKEAAKERAKEIAEAVKAQATATKEATVISKEYAASIAQQAVDAAALLGPMSAQLEKINQVRDATIQAAQAKLREWQASATVADVNGRLGAEKQKETNAVIDNAKAHADAAREIVLGYETVESASKATGESQAALAKIETERLKEWQQHIDEVAQSYATLADGLIGIANITKQLGGGKAVVGALGETAGSLQTIGGFVKRGGLTNIFGGGGEDENGNWVKDSASQVAVKLMGGIASAIPLAGSAISLIKAVAGVFGKSEAEKIGDDFGGAISESLAKAMEATESKDHVSRGIAEMLHSSGVFEETGKTGGIFDLMNAVKLGVAPAKEGIDELSKAFGDLQKAADGGSIASESAMVDMIARSRELGESIPALDAYVQKLMVDAGTQLQTLLSAQSGHVGIGGDAQASANNQLFGAVFQGQIAQLGLVAAMQTQGPAIDALQQSHPGGPLTGAAADAAMLAPLMKESGFKDAATGLQATGKLTKDLLDTSNLSQSSLDALETTSKTFYDQAYSTASEHLGVAESQKAAEEAALPALQAMQHAQAMGLKLSPDMQGMLAQAQKDGLLPALGVAEQQLSVLRDIRDGKKGDSSPATGAPGDPTSPNGTNDPGPSAPPLDLGQDPDGYTRHAASGFQGWVTKPTRFLAGEAGPEYMSITPSGQAPPSGGGGGGRVEALLQAILGAMQQGSVVNLDGIQVGRAFGQLNANGRLAITRVS